MFSLLIAAHDEIIASTQLTAGIGQSASERMCARAAPRRLHLPSPLPPASPYSFALPKISTLTTVRTS